MVADMIATHGLSGVAHAGSSKSRDAAFVATLAGSQRRTT
jgi:hypothetical protein